MATTMPLRQPRLMKVTIRTMRRASMNEPSKSPTSAATTADWSCSRPTSTPRGRVGSTAAMRSETRRPSDSMLPPSAMLMPMPMAGWPL